MAHQPSDQSIETGTISPDQDQPAFAWQINYDQPCLIHDNLLSNESQYVFGDSLESGPPVDVDYYSDEHIWRLTEAPCATM